MPTKTPQDRKPKAEDDYTFTAAGKRYKLPPITEKTAANIPGGVTMDAVMEPDNPTVQMRLGLATLQAAGPSAAAMAALRSLGTEEMLTVVGEWMGKAGGSSDSSADTGEPSSTTSGPASA